MSADAQEVMGFLRSTLQKKSAEIWAMTEKTHSQQIFEVMTLNKSIYEWRTELTKHPKDELLPLDTLVLLGEAITDLVSSLNSTMNGFYRQGMASLRSCLEMTLAFVYFVDHPIEYRRWRNVSGNDNELKITKWLSEGFLSNQYIKYFVPTEKITKPENQGNAKDTECGEGKSWLTSLMQKEYSNLSKFVHAQKHDTMQVKRGSLRIEYNKSRFDRWKDNVVDVVVLCNLALTTRFWKELHATESLKKTVQQVLKTNGVYDI